MPRAYYNEIDPFAVRWLRILITMGLIAFGDVDDRSIEDVTPSDIAGYTQCHFFAGIGGWSYALRLSGWSDSRPVWTLSCPCQPFSAAGKGNGFADERHLWPVAHWLIAQRRPLTIFGEQVASPAGLAWFDTVSADLERTAYSSRAIDLCAASIGAPHIRQRLYFRADSNFSADKRIMLRETIGEGIIRFSKGSSERCDSSGEGLQEQSKLGRLSKETMEPSAWETLICSGYTREWWRACDWWYGKDDKYRPIEPGLFPLAHGVPARVGRLRGYGNAIVPELAAEFIQASEEV